MVKLLTVNQDGTALCQWLVSVCLSVCIFQLCPNRHSVPAVCLSVRRSVPFNISHEVCQWTQQYTISTTIHTRQLQQYTKEIYNNTYSVQQYTQDNYNNTHSVQQYTQDNYNNTHSVQYTQDNYSNTRKTTTTIHKTNQQPVNTALGPDHSEMSERHNDRAAVLSGKGLQ